MQWPVAKVIWPNCTHCLGKFSSRYIPFERHFSWLILCFNLFSLSLTLLLLPLLFSLCSLIGLSWVEKGSRPNLKRPLAHHGNAANLEDKTKEIFSSGNWDLFSCKKKSYCSVLQIGCIPMDAQGVYRLVRWKKKTSSQERAHWISKQSKFHVVWLNIDWEVSFRELWKLETVSYTIFKSVFLDYYSSKWCNVSYTRHRIRRAFKIRVRPQHLKMRT